MNNAPSAASMRRYQPFHLVTGSCLANSSIIRPSRAAPAASFSSSFAQPCSSATGLRPMAGIVNPPKLACGIVVKPDCSTSGPSSPKRCENRNSSKLRGQMRFRISCRLETRRFAGVRVRAGP